MIIKHRKIILSLLLLLFFAMIIFWDDGIYFDFKVLFLSFSIGAVCIVNLINQFERPYSFHIITNIFFLFFIAISPAIQFKRGVHFMGDNGILSTDAFMLGNSFFLIIIIFYTFFYTSFYKYLFKYKNIVIFKRKDFNVKMWSTSSIVVSVIFVGILVFWFLDFEINKLYLRNNLTKDFENYNRPLFGIISILRATPLVLYIFLKFKKYESNFIYLFLFIAIVFLNFPLSIPRFRVATIYIPLLIIVFNKYIKGYVFSVAFISSLLIVFPFLHQFRYNLNRISFSFNYFSMFTELHFDSYQNAVNVIVNDIVTNGMQLLGVLFFFVPRNIWESKPEQSSELLANKLNYDGFSNVAMNFFGEGYINFGYLGVFLFLVILVVMNVVFDWFFWERKSNSNLFKTIYLVLLVLEFYLLRGSLLPAFAGFIGYLTLIILIYVVLNGVNYNKKYKVI